MFNRKLDLNALLNDNSHFLFGPRGTGKTTLYESSLKDYRVYDLLEDEMYLKLNSRPRLIEEENLADPKSFLVIDEVQKLPKILDEVQRLITKYKWKFLLTGSSARKLKRNNANLLGGRAWEAHLFPLTYSEIENFNLLQYLNRGGLPFVYGNQKFQLHLKNYINVYLKEEIISEAIVKNYEYFMNFLDVVALSSGKEINFENIASDAGVPPRTVLNYVQILEDTLMCHLLRPYRKTKSRKAISKSKLYLFDIGVANTLAKRGEILEGGELFGPTFEHFIVNEVKAFLSYSRIDKDITFWRTTDKLEVDLIVGDEVAIEIKSSKMANENHVKSLATLKKENLFKRYILISLDQNKRILDGIEIIPWKQFLKELWSGKIC